MWIVRVEFIRVQTFLFAVPRLLNIIGANTLLGEVLRCDLQTLAEGAGLPRDATCPQNLPVAGRDDPLTEVSASDDDLDNPNHLYKNGILTRDGGHFSALFADEAQAKQFAYNASLHIRQKLAGLRFSVTAPAEWPEKPKNSAEDQNSDAVHPTASCKVIKEADCTALQGYQLPTVPSLQICQESGRGVASKTLIDPKGEKRYVSKAVFASRKRGKAFRGHGGENLPRDIASLLARAFPEGEPPQDFDQLCGGHYLALIHADGNGIGALSNKVRGEEPKEKNFQNYLDREARGERFFHVMRVAVRKAVLNAVEKVFKDDSERAQGGVHPYRLLMLGGDDLLFVCRAAKSLCFVLEYARALAAGPTLPVKFAGDGQPTQTESLSVGVGVAIAKPSFPFYRLHEIAEELASSAKRLTRIEGAPRASVVDWAVCTEAWMDDVEAARAGDAIAYTAGERTETLALSGKPYFILDEAFSGRSEKFSTLESLIGAAEELGGMPRSQRRSLVGELRCGRRHAELCVRELKISSPRAWDAMRAAGLIDGEGKPCLWRKDGGAGRYLATYADLVEITELPNLKLGDDRLQDRDAVRGEEEKDVT